MLARALFVVYQMVFFLGLNAPPLLTSAFEHGIMYCEKIIALMERPWA